LIIDCEENEKKGEDIYSIDYITFKSFKHEVKVDYKCIEGIY